MLQFWPRRIKSQLIVGIVLVHMVLMMTFVFDVVNRQRIFLRNQNLEQSTLLAQDFAFYASPYVTGHEYDGLQKLMDKYKQFAHLKYAMILSEDMVILAHTDNKLLGLSPVDSISKQVKGISGLQVLIHDNELLDLAMPVTNSLTGNIIGYVRLGVDESYIESNVSTIYRQGVIYIILAISIGVLVAIFIGNRLTRGLYTLVAVANNIRAGFSSNRVEKFRTPELQDLGLAFNQMLDTINAQERHMTYVVENMPVGVWFITENGKLNFCNSAAKAIWGIPENHKFDDFEFLRGTNAETGEVILLNDWIRKDSNGRLAEFHNVKLDISGLDAVIKTILHSSFAIVDDSGIVTGAIVIHVDITDKMAMELSLIEKEQQLRMIIEHTPIALAVFDLNMNYVIASKQWRVTNNLLDREISGKNHYVLEPHIPEKWRAVHQKCLAGSVERREEESFISFDGTLKWRRWAVHPWRTSLGEIGGIIIVSEDITARKESDLNFQSLVERSLVGVYIIQHDRYVYVNPKCKEIFGFAPDDPHFIERSPLENVFIEDRQLAIAQIDRRVSGKTNIAHYEIRGVKIDGTVIWLEIIGSTTVYQGKKALIGTIQDITEKKNSQFTLLETNRAIEKLNRLYKFAGGINDMMLHVNDVNLLFRDACTLAVELSGFVYTGIGILDANGTRLNMVAGYDRHIGVHKSDGSDFGLIDIHTIPLLQSCIRNGRVEYFNSIPFSHHATGALRQLISSELQSGIFIPIMVKNDMVSVMMIFSDEQDYFTNTEIEMLSDIANNIGFAVEKLQIEQQQIKAESELRESEEKFKMLVEETSVGVFILQSNIFKYVNPGIEKLLGYAQEEIIDKLEFSRFIDVADKGKLKQLKQWWYSPDLSDKFYLQILNRENRKLYVEIIASKIQFGGETAIIGTVIDLTREMEEENRIRKAVTEAQEEERQQISLELHDNVKQIMAAALLNMDLIGLNLNDKGALIDSMTTVRSYILQAINEVRRISHQLAPGVDMSVSLLDKVKGLISSLRVEKKMLVTYDFSENTDALVYEIQLALYRILQEQVSNVIKYSAAKSLLISLQCANQNLVLTIKDDGIGFDPDIKKTGIGLENIKRRVSVLNGSVLINAAPGKGCEIVVRLPF